MCGCRHGQCRRAPNLSGTRAPLRREYVAKVLMSSVPGLKQSDAYVIMQQAHKCAARDVWRWHGLPHPI